MDPNTNRFVPITVTKASEHNKTKEQQRRLNQRLKKNSELLQQTAGLLRPDGSPVPKHWSIFQLGEEIVIKDYLFKIAYIGETSILFEPVGPVVLDGLEKGDR